MNDYEKGWVAALIDSEGCLNLRHQIVIGNTNFMMLEKARQLIGGQIVFWVGRKKVCWALRIGPRIWKSWLPQIPLIEKENARQSFLLWALGPHKKGQFKLDKPLSMTPAQEKA